jgi:hypothetical protein
MCTSFEAVQDVVLAAEPAQHHDCLPERAQRPAAAWGATQSAFLVQESRNVLNECAGDIERGTISNHVEPSGLERSCGESSSTGGSTSVSGLRRLLPKSPERHRRCPRNLNYPIYFAEITSMSSSELLKGATTPDNDRPPDLAPTKITMQKSGSLRIQPSAHSSLPMTPFQGSSSSKSQAAAAP